ncbi:MAG: hypothetical protein IJS14_15330 [Lentisphaeria bacterium]|nr:hypothetical protein [Lentisphaeria bacterium]
MKTRLLIWGSYALEALLFIAAFIILPLTALGELFSNSISFAFKKIDEWREKVSNNL